MRRTDEGEERTFEVSVEIPLTLRFKVAARNEDDAFKVAKDELEEMHLKTFSRLTPLRWWV